MDAPAKSESNRSASGPCGASAAAGEIKGVIIACYKHDYWLTRIAIASIRYHCPDIEISLLVDKAAGDFSTTDSEKYWGVKILDVGRRKWGNPYSKFELLTASLKGRYLYIDSDIVFLGDVCKRLSATSTQFVVSGSVDVHDPRDERVQAIYYDFDTIKTYDPSFEYPGYVFNAGQYVFTGGVIPATRLDAVVEMCGLPKSKVPGIRARDQGTLNYFFPKLAQENWLTLSTEQFKIWASFQNDYFMKLDMHDILSGQLPCLAHWAGAKHGLISQFPRGDVLSHFNDCYFARVPYGRIKKAKVSIDRISRWLVRQSMHQTKLFIVRVVRSVSGLK